ncbi:MAG: adenylate kinase [Alphaproteobacteria bacterium]|nr:adenylate kinase [Alphaproteobacteria bacterium]
MPFNVVFFGPPAAGKGTQAKIMEEKYGLVQLSTGDMLRTQAAAGTELGIQARDLMNQGKLVPDEVVIGMIAHCIDNLEQPKGFIFDGFPRTVAQAQALDHMLGDRGQQIDLVMELKVNDDILIERVEKRAKEEGRMDDTVDAMKTRLEQYRNYSAEVLPYYRAQGDIFVINGMNSIEEVTAQIETILARDLAA